VPISSAGSFRIDAATSNEFEPGNGSSRLSFRAELSKREDVRALVKALASKLLR